jgi:hypothetical protein
MDVRRGPAVVLSVVLGAAALGVAPGATASDGGAAAEAVDRLPKGFAFDGEVDAATCDKGSKVKLKVDEDADGRLVAAGIVWSDDDDVWGWRFRHNDDTSAKGEVKAKDADRSFRIVRSMVNLNGPDKVVFRAVNTVTDEVCRADLYY